MMVTCQSCGEKNDNNTLHCINCGALLKPQNIEIRELKEELRELKSYFEKKIAFLEHQIYTAESKLISQSNNEHRSNIRTFENHINEKTEVDEDKANIIEEQDDVIEEEVVIENHQNIEIDFHQKVEERDKEESYLEDSFKEEVSNVVMESVSGPLNEFKNQFSDFYYHYKREGKLPVLFMTIGGIAAVLLGLGLLMQFVSDTLFEIIKNIATFSTAMVVVFFGTRLIRKGEKYEEFGSALLGLGVAINYLVIYFQIENPVIFYFSNYYLIFLLIVINTFWANWLALKYETKIVALISLIGGSFAPFYLNNDNIPVFYFGYLWILCASSIYITYKINWKPLAGIAFLVASIAIGESFINYSNNTLVTYTIVFHAFSYLFLYYVLFDGKKIKLTLVRGEVVVLIGAISLLLTSLFFLYTSNNLDEVLGYVYLINALVFIVGFFIQIKRLTKPIKLLYFLIIGTFIGAAIPSIFDQELMGVFWSLEGLALVFTGYIFMLPSVRKEGLVVLLIGVFKILLVLGPITELNPSELWSTAFINLLLLGVVVLVLKIIIDKNKNISSVSELNISHFIFEFLSFWAMVVMFKVSYYFLQQLTFNLAIIPMYAFIWWGYRNKLGVTEFLGFSLYILLVFGFINSAIEVGSFSFREQTLLGKIAMVEIYLSLWFLLFFYEKVLNKKEGLEFVELLRKLFYFLLPLLMIPSAYRYYFEYLPVAFWSGVVICFVLYKLLKYKFLIAELYILIVASSFAIFTNLTPLNVGLGAFVLFGIMIYKKGYLKQQSQEISFKMIYSYAFYYLGFVIVLLILDNTLLKYFWNIIILIPVSYFGLLAFLRKWIHPMRDNYLFSFSIGFLFLIVGSILIFIEPQEFQPINRIIFILCLIVYHFMLYNKRLLFPKIKSQNEHKLNIIILHLANMLIYTGLISFYSKTMGVGVTIALVLHAIILLFNAQRERYQWIIKFSIGLFVLALLKVGFKDMEHFSIQEKIVSFLIIGVLLLGGGLVYLRLGKKEKSIHTIHEREQEKT